MSHILSSVTLTTALPSNTHTHTVATFVPDLFQTWKQTQKHQPGFLTWKLTADLTPSRYKCVRTPPWLRNSRMESR